MRRMRWGLAALAAAIVLAPLTMAAVADDAVAPEAGTPPAAAKTASKNVRIVFTVLPSSKKATVSWGKKKLGVIAPHAPLIVQRPRDSGPLDVVVRAEGCVPVQTRAYTFGDSKVGVKMWTPDQKKGLIGYREAPPDAGAPPPAATTETRPPDAGFFFR